MILKGKSIKELEAFFLDRKEPRFRAAQAFRRINQHLEEDINNFLEFPKALRKDLEEEEALPKLKIAHNTHTKENQKDKTQKLIFQTHSSRNRLLQIESVWIVSPKRKTACISSQVGCTLNCSFCATGTLPFQGNLEAWEILDQVYELVRLHPEERLNNVVFMGMGEPFHNYDKVIKAAQILNHPMGLHIGASHITISTAGVIPYIERFIQEKQPFNLAVSLNHVNDEGRTKIMDINKKYPLEALLKILRRFTKELNRRITFEYVMIPNVNMDVEAGKKLIKIAHSIRCKINLIPLNTNLQGFRRPNSQEIYKFQNQLLEANLSVFNRGSPGLGICGACGMLALKKP